MARFKFRLEQVLKYRSQLEDQARMVFAQARAELAAQAEKLARLRKNLDSQESMPYQSAQEYWLRGNFIRSLREDIAEAEIALQRLELLVERRRHEMVKASQERQLLDKLKEKQAERHAHEQEIKEQNNLDEIASIRHEAQVV